MRSVVKALLPSEHGSWAFVLEPILIGGILGHTLQAWLLGLGAFLGFLAFRPALLAFADLSKGKRYPRSMPAVVTALVLGLACAYFLISYCIYLPSVRITLGGFALLGLVFLVVDHKAKPRSLSRELLGAVLTIPVALSMALARPTLAALFPWIGALMVLRAVVSVLTVRGIIGRSSDARNGALLAMALSLGLPLLGYRIGGLEIPIAYSLVTFRAFWFGCTPGRTRIAKVIGFQELVVSAVVVCSWIWLAT